MSWSQPATHGNLPQERRYHSASVVDGTVLIFGGQYYDVERDLHFECADSLAEFDLKSLTWSAPVVEKQCVYNHRVTAA